ncbi:MAG: cytochrome c3 family protein, partial [Candidatus Aminicenantes bacterium]|nr:cytochrome c3 family protein [Candidatus Aminicenantes bacterium]
KKIKVARYKPISTKCYDCHSKFDHNTTSFPLKGRHRSTDCKQCHNKKIPNVKRYNKSDSGIKKCVSCHKSPHPGVKGECAKCHNEETWRTDSWL